MQENKPKHIKDTINIVTTTENEHEKKKSSCCWNFSLYLNIDSNE
jgi:hypothetical protein